VSRILFSSGVIQFRTGVQIIPEGSTAEDCICCGDVLPDCSFCNGPGEGGPFRRLDYSQVVTGFTSSQHNIYFIDSSCGVGVVNNNRYHVFKCSGLDVINGTYEYSSTNECTAGGLTVDLEATIVFERRLRGVFDGPDVCEVGTLEFTYTWNTVRLTLGPDTLSVVPFPSTAPTGTNCYPRWRTNLAVQTGCSNYSGSNNVTLNQAAAISANLCDGFANFSYGFTTTATGVS
jgi:hypothetical protein